MTGTVTTPTTDTQASLTAADRCDRCGARAAVRAVLPNGLDLLFCQHHARAHELALKAKSAVIN